MFRSQIERIFLDDKAVESKEADVPILGFGRYQLFASSD